MCVMFVAVIFFLCPSNADILGNIHFAVQFFILYILLLLRFQLYFCVSILFYFLRLFVLFA